jgi:hypothetical protein
VFFIKNWEILYPDAEVVGNLSALGTNSLDAGDPHDISATADE